MQPALPSPPRLEAGAAANQASLAAPSASVYRGQMEARPHMLPHIRWQLEEGGWGVPRRYGSPPSARATSFELQDAPECRSSARMLLNLDPAGSYEFLENTSDIRSDRQARPCSERLQSV